MSKSAALRTVDQNALWKLVNECRELGDDTSVWRLRYCEGLAELTDTDLAASGEFVGCADLRPQAVGMVEWGWGRGFHREKWAEAMQRHQQRMAFSPMLMAYCRRLQTDDGAALTRKDLLCDAEWYRSPYYVDVQSAVGVDHTLKCYRSVGTDLHAALALARAIHEPDYTARQRRLVAEAQRLVTPLIGGPLARFDEPSPTELAPRERQVLACLLEGDSDKQVAARMKLSTYTVNQYVKSIFAHFHVNSRPELLARWIRRGWGNKGGWRPT